MDEADSRLRRLQLIHRSLAGGPGIRGLSIDPDLNHRGGVNARDLPLASDTRQFIAAAVSEASRLGHEYFGTEHLAFALARPADPAKAIMLRRLGVDLDSVRRDLDATVLPGSAVLAPDAQRPDTSRTMQVFSFAADYARELGRPTIEVGHLLLGMLRERLNIGAQVLAHHGLTMEAVRAEVERLGPGEGPGPA
jgi:ATP-dependent Clp protease ATP-binding subunit ClpC